MDVAVGEVAAVVAELEMLGCDMALPFVFGAECAGAAVVGEAADELAAAGDFWFASLFDLSRCWSRSPGGSGSGGPVTKGRLALLHAICRRGWFIVLQVISRGWRSRKVMILEQVLINDWRFSRNRGNQSYVFLFDITLHIIQRKRWHVRLKQHHTLMILLDLHLRKSHRRRQLPRRRIPVILRWDHGIVLRVRRRHVATDIITPAATAGAVQPRRRRRMAGPRRWELI